MVFVYIFMIIRELIKAKCFGEFASQFSWRCGCWWFFMGLPGIFMANFQIWVGFLVIIMEIFKWIFKYKKWNPSKETQRCLKHHVMPTKMTDSRREDVKFHKLSYVMKHSCLNNKRVDLMENDKILDISYMIYVPCTYCILCSRVSSGS